MRRWYVAVLIFLGILVLLYSGLGSSPIVEEVDARVTDEDDALDTDSGQFVSQYFDTKHWRHNPSCASGSVTLWDFLKGEEHMEASTKNESNAKRHILVDDKILALTLEHLFAKGTPSSRYIVNFGANDGKEGDALYPLFKSGFAGVAVEAAEKHWKNLNKNLPMENVTKLSKPVTPFNVVGILTRAGAPQSPDLFKVDIDGYDVFVTDALLKSGRFRPKVILMEINEKIPVPIMFSVNYHRKYRWNADHYYGVSYSMLYHILSEHNSMPLNLFLNNAIFVDGQFCEAFRGIITEEAELYNRGYRHRPDRQELFPWNQTLIHGKPATHTPSCEAFRNI